MSSRSGSRKSIRVVVRCRPPLGHETQTRADAVVVDMDKRMVLANVMVGDKPRTKQFAYDVVLDSSCSQHDVWEAAGVGEFIDSAVGGFHATIFAYGQTGSGKTFTMEGFKYTKDKKGGPPSVDFEKSDPELFGITPRTIQTLYDKMAADTERRYTVKCSYVQIYKEQAYDLLNPQSAVQTDEKGSWDYQAGFGTLKLRWSKAEDFYLENLFKVQCGSADEALALFRHGVSNKIMASHAMNNSSSRSHCLFTMYIDSCPVDYPTEVSSSKLTLVDLAGSERQALIGANEATIKEESISINKSLFTLRQVITSLCEASAAAAASPGGGAHGAGGGGGGGGGGSHIPYRDSKLTALLKNSLGGTSMTMMIACIAPVDTYIEENISTLEYANRTKKITNNVVLNEDPRNRLIRELRAEVEFLRGQLEAARAELAGRSSLLGGAAGGGGEDYGSGVGGDYGGGDELPLDQQPTTEAAGGGESGVGADNAGGRGGSDGDGGVLVLEPPGGRPPPAAVVRSRTPAAAAQPPSANGGGAFAPAGSAAADELSARLLQSTKNDVDALAHKLLQAVKLIQSLSSSNAALRSAYDRVSRGTESMKADNEGLMVENAGLRDRLSLYESLVAAETQRSQQQQAAAAAAGGGGAESSGGDASLPPGAYTASTAALIELHELRRENAMLHDRLRALETGLAPGGGGGGGSGLPPPAPSSSARTTQEGLPAAGRFNRADSAAGAKPAHSGAAAAASSVSTAANRRASGSGAGPRQSSATSGLTSGKGGLSVDEMRTMLRVSSGGDLDKMAGGGGDHLSMAAGGGGGGPVPQQLLSEVQAHLASRAFASNVRVSTTGKLLPTAGLHPSSRPGSEAPHGGASSSQRAASAAAATSAMGDDPERKLSHLMSERNALARNRIASGQNGGS